MRFSTCLAAAACVLTIAGRAAALDFDASGRATLPKDALFTQSFEAKVSSFGTTSDALEGTAAGTLAARTQGTIALSISGGNQAIETSVWARGGALDAYLYLLPAQKSGAAVLVPLFATGRVTSDGWYEMRSTSFSLDSSTTSSAYLYLISDADDEVAVDAVEVDVGGPFHPSVACDDATPCEAGLVCTVGVCREAAAAVPPLPPAEDRPKIAEMFASELESFYGGVYTRSQYLPKAKAALDGMAAAADAPAFWKQLLVALHELHDAHTFGYVGYTPYVQTKVCFVEGDGDLTHDVAPSDGTYPDILVSHGSPDAGLLPGDRLVAVDGLHPVAWMRSLKGRYAGGFLACDDESHSYEALSLATAIPVHATTIRVVSCPDGVCAPPRDIAVATLPTAPQGTINCDQRIGFHFTTGNPDPVTHVLSSFVVTGQLAGTTDAEALYGATFDSFYPDGTGDPFTAAVDLAQTKAKGFLIDHRPGGGGYATFATELTFPFRPTETLGVSTSPVVYGYDGAWDQTKGKAIYDGFSAKEGVVVGSATPKAGLKGAILIANGESSGDFFPWEIQGPVNVRVFGRRTQGAFSTAFYLAFGPMKYGFGSGDTFQTDGTSKVGHGDIPDEEVLPRQSDIVKGVDTAYERALAWLRTDGGMK